jgi:hypothetical protein
MVEINWECAILGEVLSRFWCGSLLEREHLEN